MATDQHGLVLILARQLASNLATPVFCVDAEGTLAFYNEPAEELLGRRFAETGALAPDEWGTMWHPETPDGEPLDPESLPLSVAFVEKRPAYRILRIRALDGSRRTISVAAFPLFAHADEFVGAMAVFWEHSAELE